MDLIFFTAQFPYGKGETFIENELPLLAGSFGRILIVTQANKDSQARSVPANIKIISIPNQVPLRYKLMALAGFFSPLLQSEKAFIKNHIKLPLTKQILSTMLGSYAQALHISDIIEKLISENGFNPGNTVLYSYWMSNVAAGLGLYRLKTEKVRAVCRVHGWDLYFERHEPPYLPFRNFIASSLDRIYCISVNGSEYLKTILGSGAGKVEVSRLGTFNNTGRRSGSSTGKITIVSCSNIIPLKRIHLIIASLALIKDIEIEWTHFGTGILEETVKQQASKQLGGLPNIKYFFAGQVSNSALLSFYAAKEVDLFINLSETEGLPVSMMEAGSFGIPVIATQVGGVGEIIKDGINGFLLPADVLPQQIAQAITAYYCLPRDKKEQVRNQAFEEWKRNYNAAVNYAGFIRKLQGG